MTTKDKVENRIRDLLPELIKNEHAQMIKFDHSVEYFVEYYPIHLEHILMAIEKVRKWYIISSRGKFADVNRYSEYGEWAEKYDLSQPFSNQSQEFYEFLWSIITP